MYLRKLRGNTQTDTQTEPSAYALGLIMYADMINCDWIWENEMVKLLMIT